MTNKRYLGLDPSLTATGYCLTDVDGTLLSKGTIKTGTRRGYPRMQYIRDQVLDLLSFPTVAMLEGYAMGTHAVKFGQGMTLAELHGILRLALYEHVPGVVAASVPPSSLKKYATGSGVAKKDTMITRAAVLYGTEPKDDNEADAMHLARMARDWWTGAKVPADYREGMKKIGVLYPEPFHRSAPRVRRRAA